MRKLQVYKSKECTNGREKNRMAISFDYSGASSFFKQSEVDYLSEFIKIAEKELVVVG
jgi:hypothetical protein